MAFHKLSIIKLESAQPETSSTELLEEQRPRDYLRTFVKAMPFLRTTIAWVTRYFSSVSPVEVGVGTCETREHPLV